MISFVFMLAVYKTHATMLASFVFSVFCIEKKQKHANSLSHSLLSLCFLLGSLTIVCLLQGRESHGEKKEISDKAE